MEACQAWQDKSQQSWSSGKAGEEDGPRMWLGCRGFSASRATSAPFPLRSTNRKSLPQSVVFPLAEPPAYKKWISAPLTGTKMGTSRSHLSIYLQPSTSILEFLLCARHCFCRGINGGKKTDFWGEGKENWGRGWGWEKRKALPKNPVGSSEFWTILMYRLFKIQYVFECLPKKRYILIK